MAATTPLQSVKLLTSGLYSETGEAVPYINSGLLTSGISNAVSLSAQPPPIINTPGVQNVWADGDNEFGQTYETYGIVNTSSLNRKAPAPNQYRAASGSTYSNTYFEDELAGTFTYSGSDLRVLATLAGGSKKTKQLVELTTITVSVHREKIPVRSCGLINPSGFARGRRTIAGTMILTQFWTDVLYRFLTDLPVGDRSLDSHYKKPDQLPAMDLILIFTDEFGHVSIRTLLGVEMVTDGTVYSMNDMFTEQTISFMANDFTPLLPIEAKVYWDKDDMSLVVQEAFMPGSTYLSGLAPATPGTYMQQLADLTAAPVINGSNTPYVKKDLNYGNTGWSLNGE